VQEECPEVQLVVAQQQAEVVVMTLLLGQVQALRGPFGPVVGVQGVKAVSKLVLVLHHLQEQVVWVLAFVEQELGLAWLREPVLQLPPLGVHLLALQEQEERVAPAGC
jgi:hypothetical protein